MIIDLNVADIQRNLYEKKTIWNIRAPEEKFSLFRFKLAMTMKDSSDVMANSTIDITKRYAEWEKPLYNNAISSIGKTTYKQNKPLAASVEMKKLRQERKELKVKYQAETNPEKRKETIHQYITKQNQIKKQAIEEETRRVTKRFEKMKEEGQPGFWKERKMLNKDDSDKWLITKDSDGKRIYDQELNKENIAKYYENLYKKAEHGCLGCFYMQKLFQFVLTSLYESLFICWFIRLSVTNF